MQDAETNTSIYFADDVNNTKSKTWKEITNKVLSVKFEYTQNSCGDGKVDEDEGEECDSESYCDDFCHCKYGITKDGICKGCGNGILEDGEVCDEGSDENELKKCTLQCTCASNYININGCFSKSTLIAIIAAAVVVIIIIVIVSIISCIL